MNRRQSGMTLLEVIVASVLLAWLSLGMYSIYNSTQQIMAKTSRIGYASLLARERLEQLMGLGFAGYTSYPNSDAGAAFDPNFFYTSAAPFKITEQRAVFNSSDNDFIRKYLLRRETTIWNYDDWNPDSTIDYRKIEVKVVWSEQPLGS